MELEEKLKAEALVLANRLDAMSDKTSEAYRVMLGHYQDIMRMLDQESSRLNDAQKLELEARKAELERDKVEFESMQKRLEADNETERLKQQRRANWWGMAQTILKGALAAGGNIAMVLLMLRANNSGETLTSFENKFIFPERFK